MREIRTLFDFGTIGSRTDGELLAQVRSGPDEREPALRILIERHGPMVLGLCRRILGDEDAAEDAFQSTFLVLVRKAESLRGCQALTSWIYGVALRVARKERARAARRRVIERQAPDGRSDCPDEQVERAELKSVIDEEVGMLPERYRLPLVLCYLEGLRHEEAARRLGCPVGTIESRLSRARERLRTRLARRGLAPTASLFGAVLRARDPFISEVPLSMVQATIEAASGVSPALLGRLAISGEWSRGVAIGLGSSLKAGLVAATLLVGAGLLAMGFSAIGAGDEPPRAEVAAVGAPTTPEAPLLPVDAGSIDPAAAPLAVQDEAKAKVPEPDKPREDLPADPAGPQTKEELKPTRASAAYAPPLAGITIDGRLDDWPPAIPRLPIDKLLPSGPGKRVGAGGLMDANLSTSGDLSAAFSVGYDPKEQLLYLAVIVRDDQLVVGHSSHLDTDAVEVYVDGLHTDRRIPIPAEKEYAALDPATVPALQYVAIPGKGMIYGLRQASNPILIHGSAKQTRTRMAYTRKGDVTTYEWAIQVFDRYPDKPTRLEPGKRIGFDVAVADKDVPATSPGGFNEPQSDRTAWIYWGPYWSGVKTCDAASLGEIILVK
jgi:RNA polymerase sigma factor (sigma-70 family)